jgi:hypothetical protein
LNIIPRFFLLVSLYIINKTIIQHKIKKYFRPRNIFTPDEPYARITKDTKVDMLRPKLAKIFLLLLLSFFSCQKVNQKLYSDINLHPTNRKGSFASKQTIEGLLYEIWDSGFIRKNDLTQKEILNNAYGVFRKAPKTLSEPEGRAYYEKRKGKKDLLMLNSSLFGHLEPAKKQPHMDKVRVKKLDREIRATLVHELFHDFWHNILDQRKRFLFSVEAEIFFIELMLSKSEHQKQQFLDYIGTGLQASLDFESFEVLLEIQDIYSLEKISTELFSILAGRAYSGESVIPRQFRKYYSVLVSDEVLYADLFFSSQDSGLERKNRQPENPEYLSEIKKSSEEHPDSIDAKDKNGFTLLHHAAYSGNKEIAQFLIDRGADTCAKATPWAWTPSFLASLQGHSEISEALFKTGMQLDSKDIHGEIPQEIASKAGHERIVEILRASH